MNSLPDTSMVYDFSGLGTLKAKASRDREDKEAIQKTAQQFEAMFLQMMMKSMRATIPDGGLIDSSQTETFEQLLDQQFAMTMSNRRSTGISQMIEEFISRAHRSSDETDGAKKFSLEGSSRNALPLVDESVKFKISEETTEKYLLNQRNMKLGGR